MAFELEEFLAEGRAARVAVGDPTLPSATVDTAQPAAPARVFDPEPFLRKLPLEKQLLFGRLRREGVDRVTALWMIFSEDRTLLC